MKTYKSKNISVDVDKAYDPFFFDPIQQGFVFPKERHEVELYQDLLQKHLVSRDADDDESSTNVMKLPEIDHIMIL